MVSAIETFHLPSPHSPRHDTPPYTNRVALVVVLHVGEVGSTAIAGLRFGTLCLTRSTATLLGGWGREGEGQRGDEGGDVTQNEALVVGIHCEPRCGTVKVMEYATRVCQIESVTTE